MKFYIKNYTEDLVNCINLIDINELEKILIEFQKIRSKKGRIFVFGNGGSSSLASHFAGDLGKNVTKDEYNRFNIMCMSDNIAAFTAYANDVGYESVFVEQLKNHTINKNDLVFAISSSGNSQNVINAVEYAKTKNTQITSLTGFTGGKLKLLSDLCIHIKFDEYEKIEDVHMAVLHIIVSYFRINDSK